ncbi:translational activator for mitochondrial COX1 [Puccinia graminis f. sp. tritici]|uniref:Translational activator for mitochondrial COX1 n=1 Tax=Puccinia graminis f. sp. tritici TaxID=56615 RepID=A0A5B0SEI8_PUCGR|nr:translational activator for mitochondrial COX1 [Puccinia graminis f. sp. tritici]KAA1134874.1 translational activator for mitochondrial COX1 [Puccinia graminis f. sp. tritici]
MSFLQSSTRTHHLWLTRTISYHPPSSSRSIFGLSWPLKKKNNKPTGDGTRTSKPARRLLDSDDLFHPLTSSPIAAMREKAGRIKSIARCPVYPSKLVAYDCPECGYPTHSSREAWEMDGEKAKYWPRLREANEDEHDLRSQRPMLEFDLPDCQPYEETITLANWDLLLYTRGFRSIDEDRSRRHVSKLLTYPMTIGAILHEFSPYSTRNQRLTLEGYRSLTALRQSLHPPLGTNTAQVLGRTINPIRIFILGARAESSLPPAVWAQLPYLFPSPDVSFQVYFIGPEVILPQQQIVGPEGATESQDVYKRGRPNSSFGVPAFSVPVSPTLTLHMIQGAYREVHDALGPFDPYTDVYFAFSPGFGFPTVPTNPSSSSSLSSLSSEQGSKQNALLDSQSIQLETNWNQDVKLILDEKCALFGAGFSPADVQRDVDALESVADIKEQFDWLLNPGENVFASLKWEVAEFDPRVAVKSNYAVWGIRGKRFELDEYSRREKLRQIA